MAQEPSMAFEQAVGVLRQYRGSARSMPRAAERCELCSAGIGHDHPHLVELVTREIFCSCDACAVLFDGLERSKFKRIPRDVYSLPGFEMSDAQWDGLIIPINLAFFFRSSIEGRMLALYPSPAGAVESLLTLESWNSIVEVNPVLRHLRPDVEALLVNRIDRPGNVNRLEYFIAPIDACYKLVGLIRSGWRGLSGGAEVWEEIDRYFGELRQRAQPAERGMYA